MKHEVVVWEANPIVPAYRIVTGMTRDEAMQRAQEALAEEGTTRAAVVDMGQRNRRGWGVTVWDSREEQACSGSLPTS